MKLLSALLAFIVAAGVWYHFSTRAIIHPPGILAPDDPVQENLADVEPFSLGNTKVAPLARFAIEARVLGTETYRLGIEADYAPVDLALGWGRMSDSAVLEKLDISQSSRFYFYRWKGSPAIPVNEIVTHSANMHMIPASDDVRTLLDHVREGHIVQFSGYLVRLDGPDGWHWKSSLTRVDSGPGACEVVWVEELSMRE